MNALSGKDKKINTFIVDSFYTLEDSCVVLQYGVTFCN